MPQGIDPLTALIKITPTTAESDNSQSITVHDNNMHNMVGNLYRQMSGTEDQYKSMINTLSQSPEFTSNPESLLKLQSYLREYPNYIALVSSLARKSVNAVETLEKAQ
ncbi:type III secretion system inner rod subunit SctI [Pantoea agglomerans]|uniref:type III secretion system inner rod subunit SctI n=1 Tax=Enterobacter agglomerans TaxID=549 RepID=UPI0013B644E0|nr:type III secretion system inner rod subunit SctI [Pantoea agglomerans]NEG59865.1 type III secretion system protein [Pantoea agglomerans]NEG98834.1 type III secretion system protein [Pantoea agglomerans]NEH05182.1 type III secretion system protein [Pantoea agglomerans]NEH16171.1 type III secretion system protein [Pantoea agglomerans]